MKAQCPNCKALFKIDDAKIPEKGGHATCSKCQTRFEVNKPLPVIEKDSAGQEIITCLKCGHVNLSLDKCAKCGYIFSEEDKQRHAVKI
jgi:predicted Zn finger-like uncharacterized protein